MSQMIPTTPLELHAPQGPGPVVESFGSSYPPAAEKASLPNPPAPAKEAEASLEGYGKHVFWGEEAEKFLKAQGLMLADIKDPMWVHDANKADKIASAVMEWAKSHGAAYYCHWFQPMGSTMRHGQTGQVQHSMFEFDDNKVPFWELKGKHLLRGETDGSSFPNGGLRQTHTAAGYLTIDPMSPIFLRTDCIFIPACFIAYTGLALDEKTPLHRAEAAMSKEGARLFGLLGHPVAGMKTNIGLEQELFFVPSSAYYRRPDLQMCGRTILGREPAVNQEGCSHYMAPINTSKSVFKCMQEIQRQCYIMGIPLKTRHREVAPNQYEFAPMFGHVFEQTDNNLMVMQITEEVAPKFGLRTLLAEKPFAGVNGSGKHNNWSISTKCGAQLLNPGDLMKKMNNDKTLFPIVMSAIVAGVDKFGDLMRMAISTPGNDFRLGAMEAPPAVISTYLGEDMTSYLKKFMENGDVGEYVAGSRDINLGLDYLPTVFAPAEDRNRTSPFPYGGMRFEFRAVGSSQNVSLVNTVLGAMCASQFKLIADRIEKGETGVAVAQDLLRNHMKIVFNGNGYDTTWPDTAKEKGLFVIASGVDAISTLSDPKNVQMFSEVGVFTPEECQARKVVMLGNYCFTVTTEAKCMIDMIRRHVIPSVRAAGMGDDHVPELEDCIVTIEQALKSVHALESADEFEKAAQESRLLRLSTMLKIRKQVDALESVVPPSLWTLASYEDLWFIDQNTE
mmetsp:Transcript_18466/g.35139  ORF Transcript_18466/g.35139 Transcript_18466/m.35139 type:complete len:731 (+) Transcript_18466:107-2299(+)|eukprot:CAMPEP_0114243936 /NCGR_PEP_ID=MMETSP0058-20121206/11065_1 /TAXON_ID=36894 /ORGANISM="Pyramimonas parkeae, CCMP726" /LENGTH=730 /DNA_ID=CAMNT_0001356829 /DNA_START=96 /DNA_END=2288 /DNA_ORIENTATION=+